MADLTSYERLLRKYLEETKAKLVLEYGPGYSTQIIASYDFVESLVSIEHDLAYYTKALNDTDGIKKVSVIHFPKKEDYITFPLKLGLKYDLIFVDGLCDWRVDCMLTAGRFLSANGVLILHDSEREKYAAGRKPFELIEESQGTAVFRLKK